MLIIDCLCEKIPAITTREGEHCDVLDEKGRWHAIKTSDGKIYQYVLIERSEAANEICRQNEIIDDEVAKHIQERKYIYHYIKNKIQSNQQLEMNDIIIAIKYLMDI